MSTVSIAMATFNGERFIREQLESIYRQTRMPDDVVIFDDRSTDSTAKIIRAFIEEKGLDKSWHLNINKERLGCEQNFLEAAKATKGDIIFYSDQDDVWYSSKIEIMVNVLEDDQEVMGVTCLSDYLDSEGKKIKKISAAFTTKRRRELVRYNLSEQIKYNRSAGLEIAFRRDILDDLIYIVKEYDIKHDQPVGMLSSLRGEYCGINEKLLAHRIHSNNLSAPRISVLSRIKYVNDQIEGNEEHLKHMKAFRDLFQNEMDSRDRIDLNEAINMTMLSIDALKSRNILNGVKLILKSNDMINKWIFINNFLCILFGDYRNFDRK